jgi:hypothetical protein
MVRAIITVPTVLKPRRRDWELAPSPVMAFRSFGPDRPRWSSDGASFNPFLPEPNRGACFSPLQGRNSTSRLAYQAAPGLSSVQGCRAGLAFQTCGFSMPCALGLRFRAGGRRGTLSSPTSVEVASLKASEPFCYSLPLSERVRQFGSPVPFHLASASLLGGKDYGSAKGL